MNKELKEFIKNNELEVVGYKKIKNIIIINTNKGKYVIKDSFKNEDKLYEYLKNKDFRYIIDSKKIDNMDIYPYIEELQVPSGEKALELVYILSNLHNKTTFYRDSSLDNIKKIYEELTNKCNYLEKYYFDMQDVIEQKVYMSPAEYLLIRNISLVYSAINYAKEHLNNWYSIKKNNTRERVVLLHNKPSLEHFLLGEDKKLISWNRSSRDIPIYDFIYFYKNGYLDLEMVDLFDKYQSKFKFSEEEKELFLTIISIPERIKFTKNNYLDCYNTSKMVRYVIKTRDFVLNESNKKEKTDK